MKNLIIVFLTTFSIFCKSQNSNFENDYNSLIQFLQEEKWTDAEKICNELLKSTELNDSLQTEKLVLRYIYIYSNAGLLNEHKINKEEALKRVQFLKGKEMIMPSHPFRENCSTNCTNFANDNKNTFYTCVTNKSATQIFSFEYVNIANRINENEINLDNKMISLKGTLNEISVEGNILPRYKLKFINGDYRIE
ncbi:hypothetical protein AAH994_15180 [Weeksellaceae bacterium A-14]